MADINVTEDYVPAENTIENLYLAFEIGGETYALDVVDIKEILPICPVTLVPESPAFVKGIFNNRGDILPLISVRLRFGMQEKQYDEVTCVIVIFHQDYLMGLIVDCVNGVYTILPESINPPPKTKLSHANQFVKNVGHTPDGIMLLLDLEKLLAY